MPIDLTTPYNPGDEDEGKTYPEAKVVEFRFGIEGNKRIEIWVQYGETVAGKWVPGKVPTKKFTLQDNALTGGTDYSAMVAANQQLYEDVAGVLYAWLSANVPKMVGEYTT